MTKKIIAMRPPWQKRLRLPAYSTKEAAQLAGTSTRTVARWFYGRLSHGEQVSKVLDGKQKHDALSYLQLIEVAVVASFRRAGVKLSQIREARQYLQQRFHEEYPFASRLLFTDGVNVLMDFESEGRSRTLGSKLIATNRRGQMAWKSIVAERLDQFEYEEGLALRWHPRGKSRPVIVDPRMGFGAPLVEGTNVATWAIKGRYAAGETIAEIQDDLGLSRDQVMAALEFEGVKLPRAA